MTRSAHLPLVTGDTVDDVGCLVDRAGERGERVRPGWWSRWTSYRRRDGAATAPGCVRLSQREHPCTCQPGHPRRPRRGGEHRVLPRAWLAAVAASVEGEVSFFNTAGGLLGLFGRNALAEDANSDEDDDIHGFRGVTLAINLESEALVDEAFDQARAAGGRVLKEPVKVFWGGYSGYFADPDGHVWEVAHNPGWPIGDDGRPQLPSSLMRQPRGCGRAAAAGRARRTTHPRKVVSAQADVVEQRVGWIGAVVVVMAGEVQGVAVTGCDRRGR